jgi:hypothetical protein
LHIHGRPRVARVAVAAVEADPVVVRGCRFTHVGAPVLLCEPGLGNYGLDILEVRRGQLALGYQAQLRSTPVPLLSYSVGAA